MLDVARALGLEARGADLVARERASLDRLRLATSSLRRPSVTVLEWTDPVFPMGNWGPQLIDIAGGELVLGNRGQQSAAVSSEQLRIADPEYLVVAPCGFNLDRALDDRIVLERYSWWSELKAVRSGKVAFADGNLFFNRSGMTVVPTAGILAEILHGTISGPRSEGTDWLWISDARARRSPAA